jgi:predicted ATPase/DNA-binding CsgD family transcriptional regulator
MASVPHLPAQTTSFIGRTKELDDLTNLLLECRFVTLVGPGGIGKTRLALETAAQLRGYRDGAFFIPLQPLDSSNHIVPTIADALDFKFFSNEDAKTQLLNYLRRKQMLLVLDNFEHLLDGVEIVNELLTQAPQVSVLVTSRERLNLSGEMIYPLQGMSIPNDVHLNQLSDYSAVELFIDRTKRIRRDFKLTNSDIEQIVQICRLVDGIPLAIVMAAAWVDVLSLPEIVSEIQKSLDFLEIETRDVPLRHRSMRAVFDQSWRLLTEVEQEVFASLTVFRGGFTREAAQAVTSTNLRTLLSLVNKSLLQRESDTGRYYIHELLRQYGEMKLQAGGQDETTQQVYIRYFVDFMEQQWPRFKTPERFDATDKIEADFENVRAMWLALIDKRRAEDLHRASSSLWIFLIALDRHFEELFELALEVVTAPTYARGHLLGCLGWFYSSLMALDKAEAVSRLGIRLLESSDVVDEILIAYLSLALALGYQGEHHERINVTQLGFELAQAHHEPWLACFCLAWWGSSLVALGTEDSIREGVYIGEKALALINTIDEYWSRAMVLADIFAFGASLSDDLAEARKHWQAALEVAEKVNKLWFLSGYHANLGYIAYQSKDYPRAGHHAWHALKTSLKMNLSWQLLDHLLLFAVLLVQKGEVERAVELFGLILNCEDKTEYAKQGAEVELETLKPLLDADAYAAALKRGESLDLYDVIDKLLQEFDTQPVDESQNPYGLSPREMDVLKLLVAGYSNREIAKELVFALGTVKWYISQIYSKLGVESRTQAIAKARELNLL